MLLVVYFVGMKTGRQQKAQRIKKPPTLSFHTQTKNTNEESGKNESTIRKTKGGGSVWRCCIVYFSGGSDVGRDVICLHFTFLKLLFQTSLHTRIIEVRMLLVVYVPGLKTGGQHKAQKTTTDQLYLPNAEEKKIKMKRRVRMKVE